MQFRSLLRVDAGFEAALSLMLIVGGATGWLTGSDFPRPVGRAAVIGAGVVLGAFAVILFVLARRSASRRVLLPLALANDATGLAALAWLIAAHGFSVVAAALVAATVAGLFALSTLQLRAAILR